MKLLAFNGSPRVGGNTSAMLERLFASLEKYGIDCEEIQIGTTLIHACRACYQCRKLGRCVNDDDPVNHWVDRMAAADAVVLASPTYFANVTSTMKAFIDRAAFSSGDRLVRKIGAPVVVGRRGGAMQTYNALMAFFGVKQMLVPGSNYWNTGSGNQPGEVKLDNEAMRTMTILGDNLAWAMQGLKKENT